MQGAAFGDRASVETPEDAVARVMASALADGVARISLTDHIPDPHLFEGLDPMVLLRLGFVPWQRLAGSLVLALSDYARRDEVLTLARRIWPDLRLGFVLTTPGDIERAVERGCRPALVERARTLCPDRYSCRRWDSRGARDALMLGAIALACSAVLAPRAALALLLVWILIANTATLLLRLTAILSLRWAVAPPPAPQAPDDLPVITLLLPILREDEVLHHLVAAMRAMDYPADRLDIIVLMEADDSRSRASLARMSLPPFMRVLEVPHDTLRTKPRALNYALPFCRGGIVGIYDAEDRPEPGQLRHVAASLAAAPMQVACVQARLDFYNPDQNWLTRCFTLEYATWFRVLLHGVQVLGVPLPLGGTSVFFRRAVLEEIGGWDAHNVTEDAELGMRLARYGYRCEMIASTTYEEANSQMMNWIGQRSRWLKGYCMTWAAHMRRPARLLADLGPRGFAGFQVLFLGAITAYLAIPLFWIMALLAVTGTVPQVMEGLTGWLWTSLWISLPAGQLVMLAAVALALRDRHDMGRFVWALTLPAYWPLGAIAAWRAVLELFTAPFHWHKTRHGLTGSQQQ